MSIFLVTWNLNKEKGNYGKTRAEFIKQLQTYDHIRDEDLDTVYFLSAPGSAEDVVDFLRQKMDDDDRLFVSRLNPGRHQGWLSTAVWDWINARLYVSDLKRVG